MSITRKPGKIFSSLRSENQAGLDAEQYDALWETMLHLNADCDDFLSREQGLITLKFLAGDNVFGVLPTSGGKSLAFQTVSRLSDGITIVISPLIALMKDQAAKHGDGKVAYFNSDLDSAQKAAIKRQLKNGKIKLLYISPERLKSTEFKDFLHACEQQVKRFVIDEAHCVIQWGYSFRVKYLHIANEIRAFQHRLKGQTIPVMLLTATASPWLQQAIINNLNIEIAPDNIIVQEKDSDRPELLISVRKCATDQAKVSWLSTQLKRGGNLYNKRGIVFSAFADGGELLGAMNSKTICQSLEDNGVRKVGYYHGGMQLDDRRIVQQQFQDGELSVLVATKAFGMGIDLPKLDFIVHFYPPLSLEEYWQEAGRGGRQMDTKKGESCMCVVLYNESDYSKLQGFPIIASFEKTLSTYTCVVRSELCFDSAKIKPRGRLRKLLNHLQDCEAIAKLPKNTKVENKQLEWWKLTKQAKAVYVIVDEAVNSNLKSKQTKRVRSNLRIRIERSGNYIRVPQRPGGGIPNLSYYNIELNWLTEPEIAALEMVDDEWADNVLLYTRYRILKDELTTREMRLLAEKISAHRNEGYSRLEYVFDSFLSADSRKTKKVILDYLGMLTPPATKEIPEEEESD